MATRTKQATRGKTRPALSRERIVAAALDLVDRRGLDALSMRALGAELGVEAMSLYKHVDGKGAIVDAMVEAAIDEVDWTGDAAAPWQQRIEHAAGGFLALGRAHPELFPLLLAREPRGDSVLRPIEAILAPLAEAGLERAQAVSVFWTLLAYLYGAVVCELGQRTDGAPQALPRSLLEAADGFPASKAAANELANCDAGDEFLAGVRRILAGSIPAT